jgi:hypothetical protein
MFDTLVEHVAARVLFLMDARIQEHLAAYTEGSDFEDKLEASVQTAVDNLDLDDTIMEAIQNLSFDVSVSR